MLVGRTHTHTHTEYYNTTFISLLNVSMMCCVLFCRCTSGCGSFSGTRTGSTDPVPVCASGGLQQGWGSGPRPLYHCADCHQSSLKSKTHKHTVLIIRWVKHSPKYQKVIVGLILAWKHNKYAKLISVKLLVMLDSFSFVLLLFVIFISSSRIKVLTV